MAPIAVSTGGSLAVSQVTINQNYHEGITKEVKWVGTNRLSTEHDLVLKTLRLLIADLCQQFKGGHPGQVRHSEPFLESENAD